MQWMESAWPIERKRKILSNLILFSNALSFWLSLEGQSFSTKEASYPRPSSCSLALNIFLVSTY